MKIQDLAVGLKVVHRQYGEGVVETVSNVDAAVLFGNVIRTVDPEYVEPLSAEPDPQSASSVSPGEQSIESLVQSALQRVGAHNPSAVVDLSPHWQNGKVVLHPRDPTLQSKEIPLDALFHKFVGIRNQLRVLEQKINSNEKLNDAEKMDLTQFITRSYGSLTSFNQLFKGD